MRIKLSSSVIGVLVGIGTVCALVAIGSGAATSARAQAAASDYVPGELIVTFDPSGGSAQASVSSVDGAALTRVSSSGGFASVAVPVGMEEEYVSRLAALPGIAAVERDTLKQPAFIPNDELYDMQWNMPMIQAEAAWDVSMGDGVTVAVLDTGIAFEAVELFGNTYARAPDLADTTFVSPYDAVAGGPDPVDENGHGTHVTGTIAQNTDNGLGVAGVAPHVQIMPVKVCQFIGCPGFAIADGINWAVDHGADIINMSLGGFTISDVERDALQYAEDSGVLVVAAAGNGGSDKKGDGYLDYPAAVDTVFSVGAIRFDKKKSAYSNYGLGDHVGLDIVAPGGDLSVDQNDDGFADGVLQNTFGFSCGAAPYGTFTTFDYCYYQGTSMATPHVSGTAALLLSKHPDLTPQQVREALRCSALDLGEPGYDELFGAGLVQAADALADSDGDGTVDCLDESPDPTPPIVSIDSATVGSGEEVTVTLSGQVNDPGLAAFAINVSFDPAVVEAVDCEPSSFGVCNTHYHGGPVVRIGAAWMPAQSGVFDIAEITFRAVATSSASTLLDIALDDFFNDDLVDLVPDTVVQDGAIFVDVAPQYPPGDVNCSGEVDVLDLLGILRDLASFAAADCIDAGDVDCDGDVDSVDALKVAQFLAGLPYTLPTGCPPIGAVG